MCYCMFVCVLYQYGHEIEMWWFCKNVWLECMNECIMECIGCVVIWIGYDFVIELVMDICYMVYVMM